MSLSLSFKVFELPLIHPFTISRYSVSIQRTVIASMSDGQFTGFGEATANPYYNSTVEKLSASISKLIPIVKNLDTLHPTEFWKIISNYLQDDYFAMCAIDIAYWDFYARKHERTLRSYWSDGTEKLPMTSFTIGLDDIEVMKNKIAEIPWPIYKIKLGTSDDMAIVEALRKSTNSIFRVDANAAWKAGNAIQYLKNLKDLGVEFIEQPLAAADVDGMKKLQANSALPLIADESCQREADVETCAGLFDGINIKLMKCGGITPALRMIKRARELGLSIMAGCMTESTVGISALAQLASLLDYLDADGAMLLAADTSTGVTFKDGKIVFADGFGSGAEMTS